MSVLSSICLISCIFIAKSAANPKFYIIETEDRPGGDGNSLAKT